jgi:hypothetical protein
MNMQDYLFPKYTGDENKEALAVETVVMSSMDINYFAIPDNGKKTEQCLEHCQ